jgi:predicted RNA-binding protein YlqC (UPF0109 family)
MLLSIVRALVDHPRDAEVLLVSSPECSMFRVYAHREDVERLIGRGGHTARALQIIVSASGRKLGRRLTLDIVQEASRPQ